MAQILSPSPSIDLSKVPYEILAHVLKFVDHKTQVFSCRLVNRDWKLAVESESLRNRAILTGKIRNRSKRYPWYYYYVLNEKLHKNLIKDPCGDAGICAWSPDTADPDWDKTLWSIEKPPVGCEVQLPLEAADEFDNGKLPEVLSCFVSTYHECKMYQDIDLAKHFPQLFLDENQFNIIVSVWCTSRFDCGSTYEITVNQIDQYDHVLTEEVSKAEFEASNDETYPKWKKIELNIVSKPGLRIVRVTHTGKDTQFWAGNYGSKITLSRLIVTVKD